MSIQFFVGFMFFVACLCVGTIILSFNPDLAESAIAHLDVSDVVLGFLFIAFAISMTATDRH